MNHLNGTYGKPDSGKVPMVYGKPVKKMKKTAKKSKKASSK